MDEEKKLTVPIKDSVFQVREIYENLDGDRPNFKLLLQVIESESKDEIGKMTSEYFPLTEKAFFKTENLMRALGLYDIEAYQIFGKKIAIKQVRTKLNKGDIKMKQLMADFEKNTWNEYFSLKKMRELPNMETKDVPNEEFNMQAEVF